MKISKIMKRSRRAAQIAVNRLTEGSCENRPKSGRKRLTNPRVYCFLIRSALSKRTKSSTDLAGDQWESYNIKVTPRMVRNHY